MSDHESIEIVIRNVPRRFEQELAQELRQIVGVEGVGCFVGDIQASAVDPAALKLIAEALIAREVGTLVVSALKGVAEGVKDSAKEWTKRKLSRSEDQKVDIVVLYGADDKPLPPSKKS